MGDLLRVGPGDQIVLDGRLVEGRMQGARQTLNAFVRAGVKPKVICGDSPETVAALARQAGLGPDLQVFSGPELQELDDVRLLDAAERGTIFGRVTPQQKERLVGALGRRHHGLRSGWLRRACSSGSSLCVPAGGPGCWSGSSDRDPCMAEACMSWSDRSFPLNTHSCITFRCSDGAEHVHSRSVMGH